MLFLVTFSILWTVSFSLPGAKETLIQYRFSGIVGRNKTYDTLTIDSVPIMWSDRRNNGFLSINTECEAPFRLTLRMIRKSFNHTTANNHTYQRTRECLLEGRRVLQVSDRIQYDGAEYLSLVGAGNTWTAAVPQALTLKQQWSSDDGRTERHKIHLEDGCTELIKAFSHDENSVPENLGVILIPALVIAAFFCQLMVSFYISRHGLKHAGGRNGYFLHNLDTFPIVFTLYICTAKKSLNHPKYIQSIVA